MLDNPNPDKARLINSGPTDRSMYELFPNPVVVEPMAWPVNWVSNTTTYQTRSVVALDIDGVLADLHTTWLARYNADFCDTLTVDKIKSWGMEDHVVPEARHAIFKYLKDASLYDDVMPYNGAHNAVYRLRQAGFRVVFVTDSPPETMGRKLTWLIQHDLIAHQDARDDYMECKDRRLVRADALLDDNHTNVTRFSGYGVLLDRPWNANFSWYSRVSTLAQFVDKVLLWSQQQLN